MLTKTNDEQTEAKSHGHEGPCAAKILFGALPEDEAGYLLWNETCFPMDCREASKQAIEILHKMVMEGRFDG